MLAAKPDILMLDEPFSALDAHLKGVLEQNLAGLFETFHGTILYVSHDIDEALRFCDRIAGIEKGHVMEVSTGNNLVNNPQSAASIRLSAARTQPLPIGLTIIGCSCPRGASKWKPTNAHQRT